MDYENKLNSSEKAEKHRFVSPTLEAGRSADYQVYNGAFKELYTYCPQLLIPLINVMFGEEYSLDEPVILIHKDQVYSGKDKLGKSYLSEKYPDALLAIGGQYYHIECECDRDDDIIIRILKYNQIIAYNNRISEEVVNNTTQIVVPEINSGVFYIKKHQNVKKDNYYFNELGVKNIPCFIVADYTLEELVAQNLYIAFPFYLIRYESYLRGKLKESRLNAILYDEDEIFMGLENAIKLNIISDKDRDKILQCTKVILDHLIVDQLDEGMVKSMVLRLCEESEEKGRQEGRMEGLKATVELLKDYCPDFQVLYQKVISNETYANVTEAQVKQYL